MSREEKTDQQKQLEELIDLFVLCMQADLKSPEHLDLGKKFNRLLDCYLEEYQSESIGTFAMRVSRMGLPYEEVLQDVIYVRGLGS